MCETETACESNVKIKHCQVFIGCSLKLLLKLKSYNFFLLLYFERWLQWQSCSRRWSHLVRYIWRKCKLKRFPQEEICSVCPPWYSHTLGWPTGKDGFVLMSNSFINTNDALRSKMYRNSPVRQTRTPLPQEVLNNTTKEQLVLHTKKKQAVKNVIFLWELGSCVCFLSPHLCL